MSQGIIPVIINYRFYCMFIVVCFLFDLRVLAYCPVDIATYAVMLLNIFHTFKIGEAISDYLAFNLFKVTIYFDMQFLLPSPFVVLLL